MAGGVRGTVLIHRSRDVGPGREPNPLRSGDEIHSVIPGHHCVGSGRAARLACPLSELECLCRALNEFVEHYHAERNHQGKDNVPLFPRDANIRREPQPVQCRERLGGLLRYYHQEAA